jgi:hypothetical protein
VKKVEERHILIRLIVSRSTSLEIRVRASDTGILVNIETTSPLTIRSYSSRWRSWILRMNSTEYLI